MTSRTATKWQGSGVSHWVIAVEAGEMLREIVNAVVVRYREVMINGSENHDTASFAFASYRNGSTQQ